METLLGLSPRSYTSVVMILFLFLLLMLYTEKGLMISSWFINLFSKKKHSASFLSLPIKFLFKYNTITYDESSDRFLCKIGNNTHLISTDGKIIFETRYYDLSFLGKGIGIFQELISNQDGTFRYISRNKLAGNGREITINRDGKKIGVYEDFILKAS